MDYDFATASSDRLDWYEKKRAKKAETTYRTVVTVHRKGDFIFPVDVLIKFDNGETIREHWDGQGRWTRFGYLKKAQVVSAEIDPDHTVQLDRNKFNNSFVVKGNARPTYKLSNYWLFLTQLASQLLAWWAV